MNGIDAKILVRYIMNRNGADLVDVESIIKNSCTIDSPCFINHITLCGTVNQLETIYSCRRSSIATAIEGLLSADNFEVFESKVVHRALHEYLTTNADFSQSLSSQFNLNIGCDTTLSLTRNLRGVNAKPC